MTTKRAKTTLALVAPGAFAGAAHAQNSITLYGIVDADTGSFELRAIPRIHQIERKAAAADVLDLPGSPGSCSAAAVDERPRC